MESQTPEKQQECFENILSNPRTVLPGNISVKKEWSDFKNIVAELFNNKAMLRDFLRVGPLHSLFFMNEQGPLMENQLFLLEKLFSPEELVVFLKESEIGNPPMIRKAEYNYTSHNTVHMLYHLARYYRQQSEDIKNVETVVEWGGGYGNMCRVLYNFAPSLKTYVIFDLPECLALQEMYLSSVFGPENVNTPEDGTIVKGKINLMTFDKFKKDSEFSADMFLSTWALSESPLEYQQQIRDLNWFGAEKLLLSFHQCGNHIPFMTESTLLGLAAKEDGARIKDVSIIPGINYYAFR